MFFPSFSALPRTTHEVVVLDGLVGLLHVGLEGTKAEGHSESELTQKLPSSVKACVVAMGSVHGNFIELTGIEEVCSAQVHC